MESYWAPTCTSNRTPHPRQVQFEARRVRDVLRAFGWDHLREELVEWNHDYYGVRRLTFEAFHEFYPTFPYLLDAQSFFATDAAGSRWAKAGTWLTDFHRTFVAERYGVILDRQMYVSDPDQVVLRKPLPEFQRGLPVAMTFPWQGIKGGLVLHTAEPLTSSSFHFDAVHADRELRFRVEQFAPWLRAVARSGWTPKGHDEDADDACAGPAPFANPVIHPTMVAVCDGDARDAWLLAWLLWATTDTAPERVLNLQVRVDGRRALSVTHEVLGELSGLSVQQVRDALTAVCERGFVVKMKGVGRRTCIWVDRNAIRTAASKAEGSTADGG